MRGFFKKTVSKAIEASGLTKEEFAYRVLPNFLLEIITRYLRVTTEGMENIPKDGPYIVIANHSGFMGFDALMINHQIFNEKKTVPRIIAHKLWFFHPDFSVHIKKLGLVPATLDNGLKILEKGHSLLLFPEGEEGNFKPSTLRYRLRRFRRGFVRLALQTGVPIIPATVIGAEESNITLSQIRWAKELFGVLIPVPLNVIPLPARWHIKFLKPIEWKKAPEKAEDIQHVTRLSREVRLILQKDIHKQLKKRDRIFL